jgi:rhodanese-related sulfurtransferase
MDRLFEFVGNHLELSAAFAALLFALWFTERSKSGAVLSPQQVTLLMNRDQAVIVDLRDKKDFSEGRITGALHIPFASLKERASELDKFRDKTIILVDKMGQHTAAAGKTLKSLGYEKVSRLQGGITEWRGSNMPLVKK